MVKENSKPAAAGRRGFLKAVALGRGARRERMHSRERQRRKSATSAAWQQTAATARRIQPGCRRGYLCGRLIDILLWRFFHNQSPSSPFPQRHDGIPVRGTSSSRLTISYRCWLSQTQLSTLCISLTKWRV